MMLNTETTGEPKSIFGENSRWLMVFLLVMFLLATLFRLYEIKAPGHLLDREYTSAIFARAYYFSNNNEIEDWRRDIAITARDQQPVLEPPLLEFIISIVYRIIGREELYFARYLTNTFWLVGGIFMFLITRKLLSVDEAVAATAYYLFVPMGVIISRSVQPDSLMMMMFLISLYLLVVYFEAPSTKRLLAATLLTGLTLLLRPLVIFAIFCAFLAFSIYSNQNWKKLINLPLITFSAGSLLPSVLYYGYGIVFAGFMRWKVSTSFMPYLLAKKDFWLGWFNNVVNVAEFMPLFLAIIGFFLIRNRKVQFLIIGLAISFMIFSVAFTYHIHTHPYYHIQLFPIIALCLGPVVVDIIRSLRQVNQRTWWLPVSLAFLFASYLGFREVRESLYRFRMEDPAMAQEIGELIQHSPRTVFVAFYYGLPVEYYGEFSGKDWPVSIEDEFYRRPGEQALTVEQRIVGLGFVPEYFVITNLDLYNRKHQDLQAYLTSNCSPLAETGSYLIYANCQPAVIN
jgi:4-amino-4-deoxy-L-arabinose transferase-like glycosyltransferase